MCEKVHKTAILLTLTLLVLGQTSTAWGLFNTHWVGGDGLWSLEGNWSNGQLPTPDAHTYIDDITNGTGPTITSGTTANTLILSGPSYDVGDNSTLTVNRGSLSVHDEWRICENGGMAAVTIGAGTVWVKNRIYLPYSGTGTARFDMLGGTTITQDLRVNTGGVLTLAGGNAHISNMLEILGGTLNVKRGLIKATALDVVRGEVNLYGGALTVTSQELFLDSDSKIEITSAAGIADEAGGILIVDGNQVNASWLDDIVFSLDPCDHGGHKNAVYNSEKDTTTITSSKPPPVPDPNRRAVLNGFMLAQMDTKISRPAEVLQVDIGCVDQLIAPGFEQWSLSDVSGQCIWAYSESSGPAMFVRHIGDNVTFIIRSRLNNDCSFRNRYDEGRGGGTLGGDLVYPYDDFGTQPGQGQMSLTMKGLLADEYKLVTYHNDPLYGLPRCELKAEVSGAVLLWQGDHNVQQSASGVDGDDFSSLSYSLVTFTASGSGDVIVTYTPTGAGGEGPNENRLKVGINGFRLFKQWATELIEP